MKHNNAIFYLLIGLAILATAYSSPAHSRQDHVVLSGDSTFYNISTHITYFEDTQKILSLDQAIEKYRQGEFKGGQKAALNFGFTPSAYWFRISIENHNSAYKRWILEQWYQLLDRMDIYIFYSDNTMEHQAAGDSVAFNSRAIPYFRPNFDIKAPPGQTIEIYMRGESAGAFQVPLYLWERETFLYKSQKELITFSLYYGILIAMLLYNMLLYISIRDTNYLYYVIYLLSYFIYQFTLNGFSFQLLWPENTWWNARALAFIMSTCSISIILFSLSFLKTKQNLPIIDTIFKLSIVAGTIIGVLILLNLNNTLVLSATILAMFTSLCSITAGFICWFKGYKPALYYLVSWLVLVIGMVAYTLKGLGVLPANHLTEYSMQLGSALEMILLSIALASRINHERRERQKAQAHALEVEKKSTELLEIRVSERTAELEEAKKKYKKLSTTDELTGLKNRRSLDNTMIKEFYRCARYKRHLTVLLIDIDFFKKINDEFGHLVGDECLKAVAKCIEKGGRWSTDYCARYGGEEFCVLLPETNTAGAKTVAERIRKTVAAMSLAIHGHKITLSVSIGAVSTIPEEDQTAEPWLEKADQALYTAKENGRNRVEVYTDIHTKQLSG